MPSASIQKVLALDPMENADRLLLASVLGWKCVVSKADNLAVGDLVVFIEIDSVVPETPLFEFLRKTKFRVRTCKLRGQVSQGLVLPLTHWPEITGLPIGTDVSLVTGVTHYEKPVPIHMKGMTGGSFPTHLVPKTDEVRIQSAPGLLEELKGVPVYITTKVDGTSASYILHDGVFYICSRNNIMKDTEENKDNLYVAMAHKYGIEAKMSAYGRNIACQGEIAGQGIQGNPLGLKEVQFFVFNVYDIDAGRYLGFTDFLFVTSKILGLSTVPIMDMNIILNESIALDDLLTLSKGNYDGTNTPKEGIVIRPLEERYSNVLSGRLSCKVINPEYKED